MTIYSLLRYPSLRSSILEIAFPPSIVPLDQSMHNVPFTSHAQLAPNLQGKMNLKITRLQLFEKVDSAIKWLNQYHA